jgi:hypothetical protein
VPRSYFDVHEGSRFIPDEDGSEFPTSSCGARTDPGGPRCRRDVRRIRDRVRSNGLGLAGLGGPLGADELDPDGCSVAPHGSHLKPAVIGNLGLELVGCGCRQGDSILALDVEILRTVQPSMPLWSMNARALIKVCGVRPFVAHPWRHLVSGEVGGVECLRLGEVPEVLHASGVRHWHARRLKVCRISAK